MRRALMFLTTCVLLGMAGGCNPFTRHFQGERTDGGGTPELVSTAPADAVLIGRSSFSTSERSTREQAMQTAREVGAEYLVFRESDLGLRTVRERTTLMTRSGAAGGTAPVNLPIPVERNWYAYEASFYRSGGGDEAIEPASVTEE